MTTQNVSSQDGPEDIPALSTVAPSIFVPTERDFTKTPPPVSDDPIVRLGATIEALDWHAARVEENMVLMFRREVERIRRNAERVECAGQDERLQYDPLRRPVKDQHRRMDNELRLEEIILREDQEAVSRILQDGKYRENGDAGTSREGPRERRPHDRPYSVPSIPMRPRGPLDPEYADLSTLRREKMFRRDVDERQTPRSAALTHVLSLVKWGWDDQIEGHRAVVQKEKDELRANLQRQILAGAEPAASAPPSSAPPAPRRMRRNSVDVDAMDIDG